MSEQFNHNLNPDDFWPDAEKMLDKHFRTKKIIRKVFYASLIIAFFSGVTVWTFYNKKNTTEQNAQEQNLSPNGQTSLSGSGKNTTSNSSSSENTSSSSIDKESVSTTSEITTSNGITSNSNKSTQTDLQNSNSSLTNISSKEQSSNKTIKSNSNNLAAASGTPNSKRIRNSKKTTDEIGPISETALQNDSRKNRKKHSGQNNTSETSVSTGDETSTLANADENSARKQKHKKNKSTQTTDATISPLATGNWKSISEKGSNASHQSDKGSQINSLAKDKQSLIEPGLLAYLPLAKADLDETIELSPALTSGITPVEPPHKVIATSWAVNAYGLLSQNYHTVSSTPFNAYALRRNNEEKNILTPGAGLSLSFLVNKWKFSAGLEYSSKGEKTSYSSSLYQDVITQSGRWDTTTVPFTITNSAYINGMQFYIYGSSIYFTNSIYVLDSTYTQVADTAKQKVSVLIPSQTNQFHYLQLPFEVSYLIRNNKLGVGIAAGLSPGLLISQKGLVLKTDESGLINLSDPKDYKTFMISGMIGIDFTYAVNTHWSILLSPQYRANLQSIYKSDAIHQKYSSATLKLGISYRLK